MIYGKWLRYDVFVTEQGFSAENEMDEMDRRAIHALLYDDDKNAVGCLRLFIDNEGYWRIGRLCVRRDLRGHELGDLLMRMALDKVLMAGGKHLRLSSQADKRGFYEKYGFEVVGEPYLDEGMEHFLMEADDQSVLRAVFSGCKGHSAAQE